MLDRSARLGLPYLAAAQAQKHVTHNESLRQLDAMVQLTLESIRTPAPPEGPRQGACWFVPEGASGAFSGHEGQLASFEAGGFEFLTLPTGCLAFIRDEWRVALFDGQGWVSPLAATPNHAAIEAHVLEEDVALSGSFTETVLVIPDRAIVFAVSTRTLTEVTGAASYDCGLAVERAKFGGSLGIVRGSSNAGVIGPTAYYAPVSVRLSANGGRFSGGLVRVAVHYFLCPVASVSSADEQWWRQASYLLDGSAPVLAADMVRERYVLNGQHCTAQDVFVRSGGAKWIVGADGTLSEVVANTLAFDSSSGRRRMLLEGAATNLFAGSDAPTAARSVAVTARAYTVSFRGTGSLTLSGAASGVLAGTGARHRVSLSVTAAAGALTLMPSGDVQCVQVEAGTLATSYIPTTSAAVTRVVDAVTWTAGASAMLAAPFTIAMRIGRHAEGGGTFFAIGATSVLAIVNNTIRGGSPSSGTQYVWSGSIGAATHIGVCFGGSTADSAISANGGAATSSGSVTFSGSASSAHIGPGSGVAFPALEMDELVVWPIKGSAGAIQDQARVWA